MAERRADDPAPRRSFAAAPWLALAVLAAAVAAPSQLRAQDRDEASDGSAWLAVTPWAGFSMRNNPGGFSFTDVAQGGVRVEVRRWATWPFVQVDRFVRPDLVCVEEFVCYDEGWQVRGGITLGSDEDTSPGLHSALAFGVGAGIVDGEATFTYLGGLGLHYTVTSRLAPRLEVRWERYPGLKNIVMAAFGLRVIL